MTRQDEAAQLELQARMPPRPGDVAVSHTAAGCCPETSRASPCRHDLTEARWAAVLFCFTLTCASLSMESRTYLQDELTRLHRTKGGAMRQSCPSLDNQPTSKQLPTLRSPSNRQPKRLVSIQFPNPKPLTNDLPLLVSPGPTSKLISICSWQNTQN